ncbi:protein kinase, partial [Myxococcota bacterium]|nr:protein kinase [Myxococcota bacterium]
MSPNEQNPPELKDISHQFKSEINEKSAYRIVRKIAQGGMGTVCEAIHCGANGFEKRVAIKQLLPKLSDDQVFVSLFVTEAKLVANLVHENIIQIYQLNRYQGGYYIVMEYVHGLSLAEFIQRHKDKHLGEELAVFIVSRIARGLAHAHSRRNAQGESLKIVHRDVCPNNTLIT